MRVLSFIVLLTFSSSFLSAQINAKLMRYMDVSDTQITFVYGGDIWVMPKEGGTAIQLTHSPGEESWPRFSPDGQSIAFTAMYQGNLDVYVMPATGGLPTRLTYQSHADRTIDWHPNGEQVLFASRMEMGQRSSRQFFLVDKKGGLPQKLDIPYGELASFSPDGSQLAYITKITENYPFKRYRGGLTSDILIYDFGTGKVENITNSHANDGKPAWANDKVYFLSDQADDMRINIWSYDTGNSTFQKVTDFADFDISFLSAGPDDLVYEAGGSLYRMDLATESQSPVDVHVISDLSTEMPHKEDVSRRIANMTASPKGTRIVFEARGELFNVPKKEGFTINLTQSSGHFDRDPSWSPDGKWLAFWSDRSGEYEMYVQKPDGSEEARQLTNRGYGFGYVIYWSPDSEKIAYIDEKNDIYIMDVESGEEVKAANLHWNRSHPGRLSYPISWSPDSRWIGYHRGIENGHDAVFVYNLETSTNHQLTSGFYDDGLPVFGTKGDYLFYLTDRNMSPHYSDMDDGTWVYPNATQIAAVSLRKDVESLFTPKNDELVLEKEKEEKDTSELVVEIDFDQIESRLKLLPVDAGNFGGLYAFDGKLVYRRFPNTGSRNGNATLEYYDLAEREDATIASDVRAAKMTADGESLLVRINSRYGIIKPNKDQKIKDAIPTSDLVMDLVPKEEWHQLFNDAWRRHRDFFYDPAMHGLDWEALGQQYGALIDDARTRWDVTNVISSLAAELSAGHTYTFGGDVESVRPQFTGFLGIDWAQDDQGFMIKRIVRPAEWDTEVRSPFDQPGVDISEGDYILSVNGVRLEADKDPYAAFEGLAGKTVSLRVSKTGSMDDAVSHVIECLSQGEEVRLRYLEWIEDNRKMVDELSDGKLGYVYMSNTGGRGQLELVSMYYGQLDKKGFIIDERFNGGGQLADRFLELLKRPVVYNLHWRHGKDHQFPIKANEGPMGMLINGWAGSGGDGLPWAFQELNAGPIVGERTLGILVGPATGHRLIDGGGITVPGARLYDNDGHWFWEGVGVTPDIKVWDDPNLLMQGRDPQMERVVQEVLKLLEENPPMQTPAPAAEDRTAEGLSGSN